MFWCELVCGCCVDTEGNQYVDMKTPDIDGPNKSFANPDYFSQTQPQQQQNQQPGALARPAMEYCNVQQHR